MSDDEGEEERTALLIIDPDAKLRAAAEGLEEVLGRPIFALDPGELDLANSEELAKAVAIVLSWDLEIRCAADLLETLRRSEAFADRKLFVASDAPTRALVVLAMSLGADGICRRPYDGEELAAALTRVGLPRPEAEAA